MDSECTKIYATIMNGAQKWTSGQGRRKDGSTITLQRRLACVVKMCFLESNILVLPVESTTSSSSCILEQSKSNTVIKISIMEEEWRFIAGIN